MWCAATELVRSFDGLLIPGGTCQSVVAAIDIYMSWTLPRKISCILPSTKPFMVRLLLLWSLFNWRTLQRVTCKFLWVRSDLKEERLGTGGAVFYRPDAICYPVNSISVHWWKVKGQNWQYMSIANLNQWIQAFSCSQTLLHFIDLCRFLLLFLFLLLISVAVLLNFLFVFVLVNL